VPTEAPNCRNSDSSPTPAPSCLCGPYDDLVLPRDSKRTDWEVELAFVIGKGGSYIDEAKAMTHVAGYAVCHDVSEREFQIERGGHLRLAR